ncbi:MAG: adenine deaminase [Actinobacteria bacterium]|nr:adenine deaminase [Actinomycetota bacterium]
MEVIMERLIRIARGLEKADLVLKNAKIVNVFTGMIEKTGIAIAKERIAGIGDYEGVSEIDLEGKYVLPGFIDGHVHIESSMLSIEEFAKAVVIHGTTTVIADPHEIANVAGLGGLDYFIKASKNLPVSVFFMLPSCVPATDFETSGARLSAEDLHSLMDREEVVGLGEMMNFPGVLNLDEEVINKIKIFKDGIIDGHAPRLTGKDLCAYVAAGIMSDHESTELEEAKEKLKQGMHIALREGSTEKDIKKLLPLVNNFTSRRCFLATDDRDIEDIIEEGHIDYLVNLAIKEGLDPVLAVQLATINAAEYFSLKSYGAIAPGYFADMIVADEINSIKINSVYKKGECVVERGKLYKPISRVDVPEAIRNSVFIDYVQPDLFKIKASGNKCRVIQIIPDEIITKSINISPKIENDYVVTDTSRDILKIAVLERHHKFGNIGIGLINGIGLKEGAIASTVAHDSHNIIAVGATDEDMAFAVNKIKDMNGGLVIVSNGKILEFLELPIGGLMSEKNLNEVYNKMKNLRLISKNLGTILKNPFAVLSFLSLAVIPELKITDKGLVDVNNSALVDLFI